MNSLNVEFFGYFAAILTTVAFLPQLIKTIKTKKKLRKSKHKIDILSAAIQCLRK